MSNRHTKGKSECPANQPTSTEDRNSRTSPLQYPFTSYSLVQRLSSSNGWQMAGTHSFRRTDRSRSGRPPLYSEQTCLKTIAFFCQTPPSPGCNRWSLKGCGRILRAPSGGDWMRYESCDYWVYSGSASFCQRVSIQTTRHHRSHGFP